MTKVVDLLLNRVEHLKEQKDYRKDDLEKLKLRRDKILQEISGIDQEIEEVKEAVDILVNESW